MPQKSVFNKIKVFLQRVRKKHRQLSFVELKLPGLFIKFQRQTDIKVPHEVTVVLPRTEIRKKCLNSDCSIYEYEFVYSSITIVDAPRHSLAAPSPEKHLMKNVKAQEK